MIPTGKLGKSYCKYERMFFRVYEEGASWQQQQHKKKEQVSSLCHCNVAQRWMRVLEFQIKFDSLSVPLSASPLAAPLQTTSVYAELGGGGVKGLGWVVVGARLHLPRTKGRAACVVLYVNGAFLCVRRCTCR